MYNRFVVDNTCRGRVLDRRNDKYSCVFEYGFDGTQRLCDFLNSMESEIDSLNKLLELICDIDGVSERCSVKELIVDELRGLDTISYESSSAWSDYVILSSFFKRIYDEDVYDYL